MKNLKVGMAALALSIGGAAFAQTTTNPWLIGVGAHGVNHVAAQGKTGEQLGSAFGGKGVFEKNQLYVMNNFTVVPPLSKLTVARNLGPGIVLDWQTSVGNIDNKKIGMDKEFMLMTGLGLQIKLAGLFGGEESWFDPYVRVGANYLRHDYENQINAVDKDGKNVGADHFALNPGLGLNLWLTKNFGLGIQGDYVGTPGDKSGVANFWQASASLLFRFGQRDRDKDGILDKDDACPDEPGIPSDDPQFNGCPDTDGDGVFDKVDACPDVAGPAENQGCPWPDTDGDGVLDKDDACPTVAGPVENNGCPWPDTDGDGILDKDDACPTVPGLPEYNGCPKPQSAYADEATGALKGILFDFDKATIRPESSDRLQQAAEIIRSSNGGTFLVTGHTDAKGNPNYNLNLSRRRAAEVVKQLENRGVDPSQLKSTGVGSRDARVPATASNEERLQDRKAVVEAISGAAWEALQKSDLPVVQKKTVKKRR